MTTSGRGRRILAGLAFLIIGGVFLVENLTDWEVHWASWWPVIIIAAGLWNLIRRSWLTGVVITALGMFFIMSTLEMWDYTIGDVWRFWPVVLILLGAKMLFGRRRKTARKAPQPVLDDRSGPGELDVTTVFREDSRRVTDRSFSGGRITCVFGGSKLNLLDAGLAGGEATLDVTAVFGGARIRVPDGWTVDVKTTNLFGGVDDDRRLRSEGAAGDRLTITGVCLFGGIKLES